MSLDYSQLQDCGRRNAMKKIILDLDTGIDDTLAMSYVLASEDAD